MPKFKVKVTVRAERTYEVEVEEKDWRVAESAAAAMWRTETGDDFQVDKVDVAEIDSEQLTFDCDECGVEIPRSAEGLCLRCWFKQEGDDVAWAISHPEVRHV